MRRGFAFLALFAYGAALGFWAASRSGPFQPPPLRALWDGSLASAAIGVAAAALATVALFVPIGFLAVALVRAAGGSGGVIRALAAEAVALGMAALVLLLWPGRSWNLADAITVALALVGCTLGVIVGRVWARGPGRGSSLLWTAVAGTAVIATAMGVLAYFSLQPEPLDLAAGPITSGEKRRVYYLVRAANPRTIRAGRTKTLRLSARDLDVLAGWAQTMAGAQAQAAVDLGPGTVKVSSSLPLTAAGRRRFLNAVVDVRPAVRDGRLSVKLDALRVGRLQVPRPILAALSPVVAAAIRHDERLRPFLEATRVLDVQPSGVSVTYGLVNAPPGYMADALGQGLTGEIDLDAVRAHVGHLVRDSQRIPAGEGAVGEALRSAFAFAQQRSADGSAVLENKASLLALGILLGHPGLQTVVGRVVELEEWRAIGPALRRARLRGRADWTRHFFVSAALTVLSADSVSDAAGLFKEELDADGGSGFSFADLLADRSGTCFALAATRDDDAARAMQQRLAGGARMEEFFPPPADLPEDITDAELERDYGGVGGERYRRLADAIESRLPWCE